MNRRFLFIFIFISLGSLSFSSFENPLERLVAGFKKYLDELPQEKIYLHFDRPSYTSGETIWFKAYLTAGADHKPSGLSRTLYVELINERGLLISQLKLFSRNGSAAGALSLSDSLPSGNYLVRAYTNWMKNGEENYFFHRSIKILNTARPLAASVEQQLLDIKFFPEGGDLVYGISSKVGFKVVGADGRGRKIKGKIVDELDKIICEFNSNHLGMGAFSFLPQKGKAYKAIVENQPEINLPSIKESGLVMVVDNISDSSNVMVTLKTNDYNQFATINMLAQTRGIVCFAARTNLSANVLKAKIPKLKFPDGVAQITITDSNGIPLAERLVFINNEEQLSVDITSDKVKYAARELVTLTVKAKDYNGEPVAANFSLAVCDDSKVLTDNNRETITTYLLLSSELRGFIESPGYYFNSANKDRAEALDYLLLTQGWRRFSFAKAMETEWQKPQYEMESGLSIKGKMVNKYNNKPVANGKVTYLPFARARDIKIVQTNSTGDFEINDLIYFDYVKALLQGETEKGNNRVKFVINSRDFLPSQFPMFPLNGKLTEFDEKIISESIKKEVTDKSDNTIMLKEITVVRPRENFDRSLYGKGTANEQVVGKPYLENLVHPLQIIQIRVPGVQVFGGGQNWTVYIQGGRMDATGAPLILVDNMPVDISTLNMIPVHDIESFIVWKSIDASIFGARGANGVIGFFTKQGSSSASAPADGVLAFNEMGFQVEREFYAPKYDVEIPEQRSDNRATLFWAPHIQTNNEGVATVSFYNHDVETSVTALIEGISAEGTPGVAVVKYEIKKN